MKKHLAILGLLVGMWALPAFGQGCAMCYSSATGTTAQGKKALSLGVLVLLVPPVGLMSAGILVAFRYGRKRDREDSTRSESEV
ncbi:MAG TPA: hypothetical protein VHR84_21125 [Terriglobales bacterium]|jgi:hypothetical protein|nr:hypothetical protein [Terriglobales bacterium]